MTRAILIDAVAREVREIDGLPDDETARLAFLHGLVRGYLEVAYMLPTGDVLFVDEDGHRNDWREGFAFLPRRYDPDILGNGVVVGREVEGDQYPGGWSHLDPVITADGVRKLVRFFRR